MSKGHSYTAAEYVPDDNLIASTEAMVEVSIMVDATARDTGNTTTTTLRRGLVLAEVTATGLYKEFDTRNADGTQLSENIVILGRDFSVADGVDDVVMAYHSGDFKSDALIVEGGSAAPTWADVQRIQRH